MVTRTTLLLALVLTLPAYGQWRPSEKAITQYIHQVWQAEDGLPQNTVNAVLQTRDGYIWLGTQEGIVRFDGVDFTVYSKSTAPGLGNHYIWNLHEDHQGRLWAGTNGGGAVVLDGNTFRSYKTTDGLDDDVVRAIFQSRDGRIWIGTAAGLNILENGQLKRFPHGGSCPAAGITSILEQNDGKLWVGTDRGVMKVSGSDCRLYTRADGIAGRSINDLHLDSTGSLWIATRRGLSRLTNDQIVTRAGGADLHEKTILSVREDSRGDIWVGTGGDGLYRLRGEQITSFTSEDGLSDAFVASIWEDNEGSLWFGTYSGGLNRLKEGSLASYTAREGLSDDFILSVFEASDRSIWIGTYGGGLNVVRDDQVEILTEKDGLGGDVVSSITEDQSGSIWLGVFGVGVARYRDGRFTLYSKGLADTNINAVHESQNEPGVIWVATDNGVGRLEGGRFTMLGPEEGLVHGRVLAIYDDPLHGLWFATVGGLSHFDGIRFRNYTTADGLSHNSILALHWDEDGYMWIGTDGGGLNRFDGDSFRAITRKDGLFDDVAYAILEDEEGMLWMSSNAGVYSTSRAALNAFADGRINSIPSISYGSADGMKSSECNGRRQPSAWKARDGRMWFASIRGVVGVDPANLTYNTVPPPVQIESISVDEEAAALGRKVVIGPDADRIVLKYTALSFLNPNAVNFKYRLDGFDHDWVDAGSERAASYTNLPPGRYTFRVIASNNDGTWNRKGASLAFRVRPYFYQTNWFAALIVLLVGGIIFSAYRLRIRYFERKTRELEAVVSIRTREIRKQKEMAEKANRVKSRLLSIAAHDLKNPLNGVRGFSQSIVNESSDGPLSEMATHIYDASQRMLGLIDDLLETAELEMEEMPLDIREVDLSLLVECVADAYRPVAAHKRQPLSVSTGAECTVMGDGRRLYAVIENLISNAIKYSPLGKRIWVSVERNYDTVRLYVRDEGPGFSQEDEVRAFKPFQQLRSEPTGGESSTGLGLSIAKQIVDLHHGQIRLETIAGAGSTFVVELPASEVALRKAVA